MIDQQTFEIMCRAPAEIPKWFEPDMSAFPEIPRPQSEPAIDSQTQQYTTPEWREYSRAWYKRSQEESRQRLAQWPSYYAKMVMEAAKGAE